MIEFSNNMMNALNSGKSEAFFLLSITDVSGNVLLATSTYYYDITVDMSGIVPGCTYITYNGDGIIANVDPPKMTSVVDSEIYKVTIADPTMSHNADTYRGKILTVATAMTDESGQPMLSASDMLVVYRGLITQCGYKLTFADIGEAHLVLSGASPMYNLDSKSATFMSDTAVRARNSTDSSCEQLYEGSRAIVLRWGRA